MIYIVEHFDKFQSCAGFLPFSCFLDDVSLSETLELISDQLKQMSKSIGIASTDKQNIAQNSYLASPTKSVTTRSTHPKYKIKYEQ